MSWEPETEYNGWKAQNTSKHADSVIDGPHDEGCRICHSDSHFARDCPEKPANSGECYGCGQVGHNRADCPSKPAEVCRLCGNEGHIAMDCSENRLFLQLGALKLDDITMEEAWAMLDKADQEKEVEDIKKGVLLYARAYPQLTLQELETAFREAEMNTYLIAKEQEIADTHTIVNLKGEPDQDFVVSFQFSPRPRRAVFAAGWPPSVEENLVRLSKAGFIMDSGRPKCRNCGEMGHIRTNCPQDKIEIPKAAITCANCNEEGHRARDCHQPRKPSKRGCRNCGNEDHIAKECPEPPMLTMSNAAIAARWDISPKTVLRANQSFAATVVKKATEQKTVLKSV